MKISYTLLSSVLLLSFCLNAVSLRAQDNKNVAITSFNEVTVSNGIDLYLTQSSSENIRINAHPELLKNVTVEKQGNSLNIAYKNNVSWGRLFKGQSIKVYVNYKTLKSITASGGSDVYTQNTLKGESLTAIASGGSDLKLNIVVKDLQLQSSGGSDVDLKGTATNMDVQASGGSDINALGLIAEYAKVSTSGGSDANVYVNKGLEASASGGSDINYKGNASVRKTSSSKGSDVTKIH